MLEPDAISIYKRIVNSAQQHPLRDTYSDLWGACVIAEALLKLGNSIERAAEKLNETVKGE